MVTGSRQLLPWLAFASICYTSPIVPYAPRAVVIGNASNLLSEYDYVVIGGGMSGLVVANRLTEDPSINVLVIEDGPLDAEDGGTALPGLPVPDKYVRTYISVPQVGLDGRTSPIIIGRVVGGGTVVNGMFANRGSTGDYDAWEKLGNPGWGWNDLLPYFKKSETFEPPSKAIADEFPGIISTDLAPHGTKGPVHFSFANFQYPIIKNFFRGWNSIGLATQPQPNAGDANGAFYGPLLLDAKNQSRSSAWYAYYKPIAGRRENFHLIPNHVVSKINFSESKKAVSVDFIPVNGTTTQTAKACREVILAAGAPNTPQILQLSGVGPKKLLSSFGIKTIVDLPGVGHNFQDQPTMYMTFSFGPGYPFPSPQWVFSNTTWYDGQVAQYYANRTGAATNPYLSGSIVAYLPLQNVTGSYTSIISCASAVNLTSILPSDTDATIFAGYQAQLKLIIDLLGSTHATVQEVAWQGGNTVPIAILKPLSRGVITINSTSPTASPVFDYRTFSHPTDLDIAVAAVRKTRDWLASPPMQEAGPPTETYPGANVTTNAEIREVIRSGLATSTWQHPTGSCAMMPLEYGGCVDSELKVYGVEGLRIVDASIMPMIIGSHTSSTVFAVAEKAADLIKAGQKGTTS